MFGRFLSILCLVELTVNDQTSIGTCKANQCKNLYTSFALSFCRNDAICKVSTTHSKFRGQHNEKSDSKKDSVQFTWTLSDQLLTKYFPLDPVKDNYVRQVPNALFSVVAPVPFKTSTKLIAYSNKVMTDFLDLDVQSALSSSEWLNIVSGSSLVPGSTPLAHRYGGHQFGEWAGQLGDGRAVMIGEYVNRKGERWELQLKGSGKTPYSRQGDGRAVLRSSVREFLCSEAMHYLGIPTSRAVSLVVSEDKTLRDQFYNGNVQPEKCAIVLRVAKSWFRIGSLEILAENEEHDLLQDLVDFFIKHHFKAIDESDPDKYLMLFSEIVNQTATLMAQWMCVGYTHGVMNTDNFSILSITIDYGPFGFLDAYDPSFVPNTSDDEGRYNYENQPDVGYFNLEKLLYSLQPLLTARQSSYSRYILDGYADIYKLQYMKLMRGKLGLTGVDKKDEYLVALLLKIMKEERCDFTMTFRHLSEISLENLIYNNIDDEFWSLKDLSHNKYFEKWVSIYTSRLKQNGNFLDEERQRTMQNYNPRYVLRNWIAHIATEHAENGDFWKVDQVFKIFKQPFIEQKEAEELGFASRPPYWAKQLKVSCSS